MPAMSAMQTHAGSNYFTIRVKYFYSTTALYPDVRTTGCQTVPLQNNYPSSKHTQNAHLENGCTRVFRHGNFCNTSLHRRWLAYEVCVQEQKCGSAPSWPLAVRENATQKEKKKKKNSTVRNLGVVKLQSKELGKILEYHAFPAQSSPTVVKAKLLQKNKNNTITVLSHTLWDVMTARPHTLCVEPHKAWNWCPVLPVGVLSESNGWTAVKCWWQTGCSFKVHYRVSYTC